MFISTLIGRLLQAVEFFRSGFGKWFVLIFQKILAYKILVIPFFIWGVIKIAISTFGLLCEAIGSYFDSIGFNGLVVGGADILAIANTVLPLDELIGLIVAWAALYAVCASIRFLRAAWAAIPLKAT